jgi:CubicO group peptidase (beta-lactamase class C family)
MGVENPHTGKPIDGKTVFQAGRLGQPVFAYLVMKLYTGGWFNIDRRLYKYLPKPLPDYPAYKDLKGDSRYKRLTARRILSHQSGLVNSRLTHPEHRLTFETSPGKGFGYSEEGYRLLQFVLELRFKGSLNDLAKSVVFDRFGMKDTSFVYEPRFEGHIAIANGVGEDSKSLATDVDVSKTFITSAGDYAEFMWPVLIEGRALNRLLCHSYFTPNVRVHSPMILEPPYPGDHPTIPKKLSWCAGWGTYRIPGSRSYFIGHRDQGIECYATLFDSRWTAISIFVAGNVQHSVITRILREIVGEIETPLKWLGFE